jgi:hypothetical protein
VGDGERVKSMIGSADGNIYEATTICRCNFQTVQSAERPHKTCVWVATGLWHDQHHLVQLMWLHAIQTALPTARDQHGILLQLAGAVLCWGSHSHGSSEGGAFPSVTSVWRIAPSTSLPRA